MTTKKYKNVVFSCTNATVDKFNDHCALYMSNKSEIGRELIAAYMSAPETMPPSERVKRVLNAFEEGDENE